MADTTFVDNSTVIVAAWLNDINDTVYTGLGGEQTASGIRTHLGLGTAALTNTGTSAGNTIVLDGTAKLPAVDGSQLTNLPAGGAPDVGIATGTLAVLHGGTGDTTAGGARTNLGLVIGTDVQAYDADTLKSDTTKALTAGYTSTPYNAGTKSSGTFTPDPANGNQQYCTNGGAFTLAPPTNATSIILEVLNNGSAGVITTSGFTKVTGSFTTTNAHKFVCNIVKTQSYSLLQIQALQ